MIINIHQQDAHISKLLLIYYNFIIYLFLCFILTIDICYCYEWDIFYSCYLHYNATIFAEQIYTFVLVNFMLCCLTVIFYSVSLGFINAHFRFCGNNYCPKRARLEWLPTGCPQSCKMLRGKHYIFKFLLAFPNQRKGLPRSCQCYRQFSSITSWFTLLPCVSFFGDFAIVCVSPTQSPPFDVFDSS